jgi:hypothetical protein
MNQLCFCSLCPSTFKGVFEQGNYNGTGGGEMADLRNYLLARFLWIPSAILRRRCPSFWGPSRPCGALHTPVHRFRA